MEYREWRKATSDLMVAGEIIASLQKGDTDKTEWLRMVLTKTYDLSDGRTGDILCLAIEMNKYIAALQIADSELYTEEDEIRESLRISMEHFDGEKDLAKLLARGDMNNVAYQKLVIEKEANLKALDQLKERYLSKEMSR